MRVSEMTGGLKTEDDNIDLIRDELSHAIDDIASRIVELSYRASVFVLEGEERTVPWLMRDIALNVITQLSLLISEELMAFHERMANK